MPQTVMTIIGTRPEAIKLVPLVLELQRRPQEFKSVVCVTGQHREMLDQVLDAFGIVPDHDLNLMAPGQSLGQITARAVAGLTEVCEQDRPDIILVQGDTTTAFCGALVGHYQQIKTGHVEAGLRTGNKFSPFPEEINRRLIGQMADLHFPPHSACRSDTALRRCLLRRRFSNRQYCHRYVVVNQRAGDSRNSGSSSGNSIFD